MLARSAWKKVGMPVAMCWLLPSLGSRELIRQNRPCALVVRPIIGLRKRLVPLARRGPGPLLLPLRGQASLGHRWALAVLALLLLMRLVVAVAKRPITGTPSRGLTPRAMALRQAT